jgi:hypothetical protein
MAWPAQMALPPLNDQNTELANKTGGSSDV